MLAALGMYIVILLCSKRGGSEKTIWGNKAQDGQVAPTFRARPGKRNLKGKKEKREKS